MSRPIIVVKKNDNNATTFHYTDSYYLLTFYTSCWKKKRRNFYNIQHQLIPMQCRHTVHLMPLSTLSHLIVYLSFVKIFKQASLCSSDEKHKVFVICQCRRRVIIEKLRNIKLWLISIINWILHKIYKIFDVKVDLFRESFAIRNHTSVFWVHVRAFPYSIFNEYVQEMEILVLVGKVGINFYLKWNKGCFNVFIVRTLLGYAFSGVAWVKQVNERGGKPNVTLGIVFQFHEFKFWHQMSLNVN